jgi:hypothetical protein
MVLWLIKTEGEFVPLVDGPLPVEISTLKATLASALNVLNIGPSDLAVMFFFQEGALRYRLVGTPRAVDDAVVLLRNEKLVSPYLVVAS